MVELDFIASLVVLSGCLLAAYLALRYHFDFWTRQNVPQIPPAIIVGNMGCLLRMRTSCSDFVRDELYNHPEAVNQPFVGIHVFNKPAVLVRDPELVKRVLVRDFAKFSDRYSNSDSQNDPMGSQNLFFLKNPKWKEIRSKLTPFFTSGRLKQMFGLIEAVGRELDSILLKQPLENQEKQSFSIELKELCALYTTDVIASVAYGVEANTLKNPNGDFRRNGREVFQFRFKRALGFLLVFFLPLWVPFFRFKVVPTEPTKFLRSTINYVMAAREKSGQIRNDLIDMLIEFKNATKREHSNNPKQFLFEGDILIAQAAIFFTAGFESSSGTMSFALYELARHVDLQSRLREEIRQALQESSGVITQKLIDSLEYMPMVIAETQRLYPPLPFLDRECTIPEGQTYSLEPFSNYRLPRGMPVYVPVYGLHMDPKYFPQPEIFDPERFSPENRKFVTPYTYMPFGLGGHGCIGERLAMLQTKIGLVNFFRNHRVSVGPKTSVPMQFDPQAIILQAKGGIYLDVIRDPLNV